MSAVFLRNLKSLLVEGRANLSELHLCRQQKIEKCNLSEILIACWTDKL
jgi:hypothetical protein